MAIQQEDLILLIVINAEVNVRCVMVCEALKNRVERVFNSRCADFVHGLFISYCNNNSFDNR